MRQIKLFFGAFKRSVMRSDFRHNPVNAVRKRIWWKLRWRLFDHPWLLTLNAGMQVFVPHSGAGALIYYLGQSEPETVKFFERYLRQGMVVLDIGAHLGEYTLRAGRIVGNQGHVYAFEPNSTLVEIVRQNIKHNGLENVTTVAVAIADQDGEMDFEIVSESSVSSLSSTVASSKHRVAETIRVKSLTLDAWWASIGYPEIDMIKIDVEGAEYLVFKGADKLLNQTPDSAPVILFEFNRSNYARFGVTCKEVLSLLGEYGYCFLQLSPQGEIRPALLAGLIVDEQTAQNLVATKNIEMLLRLMDIREMDFPCQVS